MDKRQAGQGDGAACDTPGDFYSGGMTLRDYFAAHATFEDVRYWLTIMAENGQMITNEQAKYVYADAMLKTRETKKNA